jgi:hypothetical protein
MQSTIPGMKSFGIILLLCALTAMGKDLKAPLPERLFQAKTVYIDNQSQHAEILDRAYTALKEWNRYQIVQDKSKAELIVVLTVSSEVRGSYTTGSVNDYGQINATTSPTRVRYTTLVVFDPTNGETLFADTRRWHPFGSATKDAVKELRKRMEAQRP